MTQSVNFEQDFKNLVSHLCSHSGLNRMAIDNAIENIVTEENINKFREKLLEVITEEQIIEATEFLKSETYNKYLEASENVTTLVGEFIKDYVNLLLSQTIGTA